MNDKTAILIGADTNQSEKSTPRRTECMKLFLNQFSLKSILTNSEPTFHHNNQVSESPIYHIYYFIPGNISSRIMMKEHLCLKQNSQNLSGQDVIVGEMKLSEEVSDEQEKNFSKSYTKFEVRKPKWNVSNCDNYQNQSSRILKELLIKFDEPGNIPILSEMFSKMLEISAEQNLETSNPSKAKKVSNSPYFPRAVIDAY